MEWPLTEREHRFLDQNQDALVEILDTCDLTNRLYSAEVINTWHKEFVESKPTRHDRNEALLNLIRRFGLKAYAKFIKCLRESNQAHIAESFESSAGKLINPSHFEASYKG